MKKNKSALLITAHKSIENRIRPALKELGLSIDTTYEPLSSLRVIKRSIVSTRNTVFLRKAFSRLLCDSGPPDLIILDYKIDLGLDERSDPDKRKIFRTLLISYILLMRKEQAPTIRARFLLIAEDNFINEARQFEANPLNALRMLNTTNQDINNLIQEMMTSPDTDKESFQIKVISPESSTKGVVDDIRYLIGYKPRDTKQEEVTEEKIKPADKKSAEEKNIEKEEESKPARIYFRTDNGCVYADGREMDEDENKSFMKMAVNEFYIIGHWNKWNQNVVAEKLRTIIKEGICDKTFHINDDIVVNLYGQAIIDSTIVASLVSLLLKDFKQHKNKKIQVNFKNANILEKSKGFTMIKQYIRHTY